MNIQQNESEDLKKRRTFWDDPEIGKRLDALPEKERSVNIRMALRQYFGITPGKTSAPIQPDEPLTLEEARLIARLMRQQSSK